MHKDRTEHGSRAGCECDVTEAVYIAYMGSWWRLRQPRDFILYGDRPRESATYSLLARGYMQKHINVAPSFRVQRVSTLCWPVKYSFQSPATRLLKGTLISKSTILGCQWYVPVDGRVALYGLRRGRLPFFCPVFHHWLHFFDWILQMSDDLKSAVSIHHYEDTGMICFFIYTVTQS